MILMLIGCYIWLMPVLMLIYYERNTIRSLLKSITKTVLQNRAIILIR